MRLHSYSDRPIRLMLPSDYQAKYAYPLVVVLHPDGGDEEWAARLAPLLSRRNYILACPRGPIALGSGDTGTQEFGWNHDASHAYLRSVVAHTQAEYHVHARRIYFVGMGEGAAVAYRFGLANRETVAGVALLNGETPVQRTNALRNLRVFVGHGSSNPLVPVLNARRVSQRLATAGADVRFQAYPTSQHIHDDMPRDVNRWIMAAVNTTPELFSSQES